MTNFKRESVVKIKQIKDDQEWEIDAEKIIVAISKAKNIVLLKETIDIHYLDDESKRIIE